MNPRLILGDCMQHLPTIPDYSIDLILTDPPYGIGSPQRITDTRKGKNRLIGGDFGSFDNKALQPEQWLPECIRCLKECGLLVSFYGARRIHKLIVAAESLGLEVVQDFHWIKENPPVPMRSVGFSWGTESGYVIRRIGKKHKHNNKAGISPNWKRTPICGGIERSMHPTQKPLNVMKWLLSHWSFPNETVIDPFMGSGTTGVACIQLGRKFIGIECNPDYFKIAQERIARTNKLPSFQEG